jgi:energy-coupling factor transporter ATP-binding protein EcfA2
MAELNSDSGRQFGDGDLTKKVLAHLEEVGFEVRPGEAQSSGEPLPLVSGVAWETRTAQLAIIAEGRAPLEIEAWRQLLCAGSEIRHRLAGDDAPAFGTPVVVAIVDAKAAGELKELAEELAQDLAVFNQIDLNLLLESDVSDGERLDDALAPLLPRCRRLRGEEISRAEVREFWKLLREEVEKAASELDVRFGKERFRVGRECAEELIGDSADAEELPAPTPIGKIGMHRLRSIKKAEVGLADVSVVHGPNGSGKTTLVEAMELAWAGRSQRVPPDVELSEYSPHLPLDGEGDFAIERDGELVRVPSRERLAQLNRCVLTHEAIDRLASATPQERFSALLEVTGLEIPDLKARTEALVRESKAEFDRVLSAAGMANLPRANIVGLKHLDKELSSELVHDFSALAELRQAESALARVSESFEPRQWVAEEHVLEHLKDADWAVTRAVAGELSEDELAKALDKAGEAVAKLQAERSRVAAATRTMLEALRDQVRAARAKEPVREEQQEEGGDESPLSTTLAARWLSHSITLRAESERFRGDASELRPEGWKRRLGDYADALQRAVELAPREELEQLSKPSVQPRVTTAKLDENVLQAAGFGEGELVAEAVGPVLLEVSEALDSQVAGLRQICRRIEAHPARQFGRHAEAVMAAACRFELVRTLRREGPTKAASEQLVCRLLDERLAPVVRELMAAMVRFEWYFKPLQVSIRAHKVVLGGLATEDADLDARLLLNSAERSVLGLSWFFALHMLQPEERRQVLVMDDPTSGFDNANIAGFASTLRAFVRLLRPRQVVIATHDEQVAAVLGEELASVDGWPESVARIRFSRDADNRSVASEEWARPGERKAALESVQPALEKLPA